MKGFLKMSLIKKAHSLLLQARNETNPRKAMLLKKASATTYNEMIAFAYIYGVITQDDDIDNVTQAMATGGDNFENGIIKLISKTQGISFRNISVARKLATEFFNASQLGNQRYYEKMIKDFTYTLKSVDKAEDAVHNILAGFNPVTQTAYQKVEAKNAFAHAGKEHSVLPALFQKTVEELKVNSLTSIPNKYQDCVNSILSTITLYNNRLKFNSRGKGLTQTESFSALTKNDDETSTPFENKIKDKDLNPEQIAGSMITENTLDRLIELFKLGYGWKSIRTPAKQRRAISHILFSMKLAYSNLSSLISSKDDMKLYSQLAYPAQKLFEDGRVIRDTKLADGLENLSIAVNQADALDEFSEFIVAVINLYESINPTDDITESVGEKAWDKAFSSFFQEIGQDIEAISSETPLLIPSAHSLIDNIAPIFKQGSQKKASLKSRVASLLRRYNQI